MRSSILTSAIAVMVACSAISLFAWAWSVRAQEFAPDYDGPKYQLDPEQENVLRIYNLYPSGAKYSCLPDQGRGRVAKRHFDESGMVITGAVLEHDDGTRELVNIEVDTKAMAPIQAGWVIPGLQKLLKEGRDVSLKLYRCGAAGRVLFADAIW